MTIKIDINATDITMDINTTAENTGEINKNEFPIYTYATETEK